MVDGTDLPGALAEEARPPAAVRHVVRRTGGGQLERTAGALAARGFEPHRDDGGLTLRNCPFDALARSHTALVCGVNLDYVGGVLDGLGCQATQARLDPAPDRCCVRVAGSGG